MVKKKQSSLTGEITMGVLKNVLYCDLGKAVQSSMQFSFKNCQMFRAFFKALDKHL